MGRIWLAVKTEVLKKIIEQKVIFDVNNREKRTNTQNGDKSLYVENNTGIIIIGADMHKRRNLVLKSSRHLVNHI